MMNYHNLLIQFQANLHGAIDNYEQKLADEQADIPSHRAIDILELRDIIDSFPEDNEALLSSSATDIVEQFKTGLQIFGWWQTGKSRLKDSLNAVINNPRYNNESFLRARNNQG